MFLARRLSALGSAAAAATGDGLLAQALAQAGAAAVTYAVNSIPNLGEAPASFSGWSLLATTAGAATAPVLGGIFSQLAQVALNPDTGWVWHSNARSWDAFYQQLVMGLGQVVIQDSFGSPRRKSPKPKQGSQPIPPAVLEDAVDEKADLAAYVVAEQFEGLQEVVPTEYYFETFDTEKSGIRQALDDSGRMYQYEVDADGVWTSFTDAGGTITPEVIYVKNSDDKAILRMTKQY